MEPRPPNMRGPSPRPPATVGSVGAGAPPGPAMQPRRPRPPQPQRSPAPGMPGVRPGMEQGQMPMAGRRSPMPPARSPIPGARSPVPGMRPPMQPARSPAPGVRPISTPVRSSARSPAPGMRPPMPARSPVPGVRPSPARSPLPRRTAVTPQPGMPAALPGAQIRRMAPTSPRPGFMGRPPPVSPGPVVRPAPGPAAAAPPPTAAAPPAGPARSKRAARAYHQDASTAPASTGWNDVMARPPPPQAAWQQQAAARVDYRAAQAPQPPQEDDLDAALDQMPGHRNVLSQSQLNFNRAALRGSQQVHPSSLGSQGVGAPGASGGAPGAGPMGQPGVGDRAQRPKIDPDHIPSPVDAQYADQQFFYHDVFGTCSREGLPLSTTSFASVDQGNCSPKFMRLTTYCVPATEEVANASKMPIALNVQPFAQLRADEERVPLSDAGESGPPRCKRCRAYINPWCLFVEGGMKWICSLCGASTEVSQDYFCNLDINGRRADLDQRPELTHGSVDFCVPTEYWAVQAPTDVSSMLPVPSIVPTYTTELTTSTRLQENVDKLDDVNMDSEGKKTAAKAAKAAGNAALDTLNLGKGHTTVRAPRPLTHVFLIDVSFSAVRCGALQTCVRAIKQALYGTEVPAPDDHGVPGFGLPPGSQVCIITFDQAMHFYNLDPNLEQAQMLVMADLEEPFIPISGGLLVDPWASRRVIENLLNELPANFANSTVAEATLGAATRTAQAVLNGIGGQLNIFLSTIPTVGPGKLTHREDTKLYGTDHEKNLFAPQDPFYLKMGEEFALAGVGVNVFFFPSQYIDVASIGFMAAQSGGQIFFHPRFDPVRDGSRVIAEVQRIVLRETAYNVTLRIRCSPGLRVVKQFGGFHLHGVTDIETGTWDADKTFTALIRHDGRLEESREAYFQCAILYTTATGERRVRCHTLAVPVTSVLGNVFRYADMDSAVAYYAKEAVTLAHDKPLKDVRSYLTAKCVAILLAYRRNCASSTSPGQLILPESFKLFPLYVLALIKNKAIKGGNVTSDVRIFFFRLLLSQSVGSIMTLLYPRMMPLHLLNANAGCPVEPAVGLSPEKQAIDDSLLKVVQLPRPMRPSFMRMEPSGAYLLDNGEWCLLWLGAQVSPKFLEDLYGVTSLDELDPRMTSLPVLPTRLSQQVRSIVQALADMHGKVMLQVVMARQNRDGMEVEFANNLVEDQNNDAMSYVDYLCHVHRVISSDMNSGRDEKDASASLWKGFI